MHLSQSVILLKYESLRLQLEPRSRIMVVHQPSSRRQTFSYRTGYGLFVTLLSAAMCVAWPFGFSSFTNPAPLGLGLGIGAGLVLLTSLCFLNWRNARITID